MDKVGALWLKKTKKGQMMMSGEVNGAKVLIFKNGFKQADKHPDYVVYNGNSDVSEINVAEGGKASAKDAKGKVKGGSKTVTGAPEKDDDIPF